MTKELLEDLRTNWGMYVRSYIIDMSKRITMDIDDELNLVAGSKGLLVVQLTAISSKVS